MAIEIEGTPVGVTASTANSSTSVTVPAGTTGVVAALAWWTGGGASLTGLTLNGVAFDFTAPGHNVAVSGDTNGYALGRISDFSDTGSRTLAWTFSSAPDEGAGIYLIFLSGNDTTEVLRDAGGIAWEGDATESITVDTDTGDIVVGYCESFESTTLADGAPAGSGQTLLVNNGSHNDLSVDICQEDTVTAGTETIEAGEMYFGVVQAASLKAAGAAAHTGAAAMTFGPLTMAGTGSHDHEGTGALSIGALSLTATASSAFLGEGAMTVGVFTLAATGLQDHQGTGALTLATLTLTATGTHGGDHIGTGAMVLTKMAMSATAQQQHTATATLTVGGLIFSASAEGEVEQSPADNAAFFGPRDFLGTGFRCLAFLIFILL